MLREAELFTAAEVMLLEVLGRIRVEDRDIELPPLGDLPGPSAATGMWSVVRRYAQDDASVPGVLSGATPDDAGVGWDEDDAGPVLARLVTDACAAAARATDAGAPVRARYGAVPTGDYLLRLAVNRSLLAHYVAAYLGSTACPLPENLARGLWELTRDDTERWRAAGIFHESMPIPDRASWRDTFLLTAGHLPHPLGH